MEYFKFKNELANIKSEEDLKNAYIKHFNISYYSSDGYNLYTPQVFFEFSCNRDITNLKVRVILLSQILYYIHNLKFGFAQKSIPIFLCLSDKNETIITETIKWKTYYSDIESYDWDLTPSIPDKRLVDKLIDDVEFRNLYVYNLENENDYNVFCKKLIYYLDTQQKFDFIDKKIITEENFENVFKYWNEIFGTSVKNGFKTSKYFICDIQQGKTHVIQDEGKIYFDFGNDEVREKKVFVNDYQRFWELYEKVTSSDILRGILSKTDRLTDEDKRRLKGEFFTPIKFANKALEYIERTIGKEWWKSGEYRIWDMASGTGNLEYYLPNDSYQYLYLSTLYPTEVEHCEKLFPSATVFQYDYLNDDIGNIFSKGGLDFGITWKLPEKLRKELHNPNIKWIILINPPFATSQTAGKNSKSKQDVSNTIVRKLMHQQNLGEVSRELFSQFLFRIKNEFAGRIAYLGLFSKIKYLNSNNDQKFRDNIFQFEFKSGFIFSSLTFSGTKGNFPVGFLFWNLTKNQKIEEQKIIVDIFNENVEKIGCKTINSENRNLFLSKWIKRPTANIKFPPLGSAINIKADNKDKRDRISNNFLASFMCAGNDFQAQNQTAFASAPFVSAGALSVTPENFEKSMVIHAVRRIPKATWINDRDQFLIPDKEISQEFINDCTIWSLFSNSNQTSAMKDVVYEKVTYQINNHFFPYLLSELKNWEIADSDISLSLSSVTDRFVAKWISEHNLSHESQSVYDAGKEIYKFYFVNLNQLRTQLFEIKTWDGGLWQIKNVLKDQNLARDLIKILKEKLIILQDKLLPQIYDYKFITKIEL